MAVTMIARVVFDKLKTGMNKNLNGRLNQFTTEVVLVVLEKNLVKKGVVFLQPGRCTALLGFGQSLRAIGAIQIKERCHGVSNRPQKLYKTQHEIPLFLANRLHRRKLPVLFQLSPTCLTTRKPGFFFLLR